MANCRVLEAPGASDSKVLGLLWLHGAALPAKAALETEYVQLPVVFRPTSESRGAASSGRVKLHAILQCHCQCPPIRPALAP